jgi:hypothetical protein
MVQADPNRYSASNEHRQAKGVMGDQSTPAKSLRHVFLSAPAGVDVTPIREALVARGVEVIGVDEWSTASTPIGDRTAELMRDADLFVGVLGAELSPTVMYEAGLASGLGKRVVLFLAPSSVELPVDMTGGLYFRLDPSSSNVGFAIDQALSAPPTRRSRPRRKTKLQPYAADLADRLALLDEVADNVTGAAIESMIQGILSVVGVQSVPAALISDADDDRRQWDLIAWDSNLQGSPSHPLLIDIKRNLPTLAPWYRHLRFRAQQTPGSAVLILYWRGDPTVAPVNDIPTNVKFLSIHELVEGLRAAPFAEVVRRAPSVSSRTR